MFSPIVPLGSNLTRKVTIMSSLQTIGGVRFGTNAPIMIGAGATKSPETTSKWLQIAPVVSGSYTPEAREGNQGNCLHWPANFDAFEKSGFGLNSFGMPNMGYAAAAKQFAEFSSEYPLIVSIAGFSVKDYLNGIAVFSKLDTVSAIECNFGCPNVAHGKIMSFDMQFLNDFFSKLEETSIPIWVKLSPYSDPGQLKEVATILNAWATKLDAVVTCNTFPNASLPETIDANNGFAGMSGRAMNAIALGQVRQFRSLLGESIDIIGVGGITAGFDVVNMFDVGASAVQLTSLPFWLPNPNAFWEKLLEDGILEPYLKTKG
jgi:dihydroorotate dehydrogenase